MKFDFLNKDGETLSGRLELPDGEMKATALFAHCFTCSKNVLAASSISKSLKKSGIGVLRFDFTGLGQSEGDFSNTNFSSNVADLVSACKALGEAHQSPKILIGHSLGGAAVLKAASTIESVEAVVTIGAPSDAEHVSHLFSKEVEQIESEGEANVSLAGRDFKIKKQFVEDLKSSHFLDELGYLKKALLIMHSPVDDTVSIDHAARIFKAAKHPKSFVSLDTADHLLSSRDETRYVASVIGAWVGRYIT